MSIRVLRFVAVASRSGAYGGPFDTSAGQAAILDADGFDVKVLAGAFGGDEPPSGALLNTFKVRHLLGRAGFSDVGTLAGVPRLWREVGGADYVHVSYAREYLPLLISLLAIVRRRQLILQPHGMLTSRSSRLHRVFDSLIARPIARRARIMIALTARESTELAAWLSGGRKNQVEIIEVGNPPLNASDLDTASEASTDHDALFVARLHPRKRVVDFARAARIAADRGWMESYRVVGPDEGDLPALIDLVNMTPRLHYAGVRDRAGVIAEVAAARVFVLPASNEPWGNVVATAINLGVPVVVTHSAALAPLVAEYGAGVVVEDGVPSQIADAVHHLMDEDNALAARNAAQALSREHLSIDVIAQRLLATYARVAAINKAGGKAR